MVNLELLNINTTIIMNKQAIDILKKHQLSITASRASILALFIKSTKALSHNTIEHKCSHAFDRVTIYRTLALFIEKGIIHTIPTTDNTTLYALCKNECTAGRHHDEHVHFICDDCGTTTCLAETDIPKIKLPKGYKVFEVQMVVTGTCGHCV